MILLLGLLPSKTFDLISGSDAFGPSSCARSEYRTKHHKRANTHLADLVLGLAERERLGLREEVGEQDAVVLRARDRVVRRRGREEVGGDELRALVHELVERVLPVRARRAPDDRLRERRKASQRRGPVKEEGEGNERRSGS